MSKLFKTLFKKKPSNFLKLDTILVSSPNVNFMFKESFSMLAINLLYSMDKSQARKICISSATPNSGKSTVSLNLAITLAEMGQRVLLIDNDLRKPVLHKYLKLGECKGLTDIICNNYLVKDAIKTGFKENLSVLCVGTIPPNPQKIVMSYEYFNLVEALSKDYDMILIDTPPMKLVADTQIVNKICSGSILVVNSEKDFTKDVNDSIEILGENFLGVVLNNSKNKYNRFKQGYYYGE